MTWMSVQNMRKIITLRTGTEMRNVSEKRSFRMKESAAGKKNAGQKNCLRNKKEAEGESAGELSFWLFWL